MAKKHKPKAKAKSKSTARRESGLVATPITVQPANDKRTHHQPHDKFFKYLFEHSEIAIDFFAAHLADLGFSKQQLENFKQAPNEYQQQPSRSKSVSDVVYHGQIGELHYYIALEHQSSFDRTIVPRLLKYAAVLMEDHIAQGYPGQAIVIPMCLYHAPHQKSRGSVNKQGPHRKPMMERLCGSKQHIEHFNRLHVLKVVDLTILSNEEIRKHGKVAILEWMLKDVQLPGNEFLLQVIEHLRLAGYGSTDTGSADFRSAILEYIIGVYNGDESQDEVINKLCEVMPQEREIMGKLADKLRAEGIAEGIAKGRHERDVEIVTNMKSEGCHSQLIQKALHLSDEEFEQLSPSSAGSPPSPQRVGSSASPKMLSQHMLSSSAAEQSASGTNNRTMADNPNTGIIFPADKGSNITKK